MEDKNTDKYSLDKLYIAYGSNLNLLQMKHRCPTARVIGASELKDYELVFRGSRESAVATIEPCEGSTVPVLLWSIKPDDEKVLDRYEGYPNFYGKSGVNITIGNYKATEMEQVLCFDTAIDAETFCNKKSAIFLIFPEEDNTKYFMTSLFLQQFYREMLTVDDENGGKLPNRSTSNEDCTSSIFRLGYYL